MVCTSSLSNCARHSTRANLCDMAKYMLKAHKQSNQKLTRTRDKEREWRNISCNAKVWIDR